LFRTLGSIGIPTHSELKYNLWKKKAMLCFRDSCERDAWKESWQNIHLGENLGLKTATVAIMFLLANDHFNYVIKMLMR
jgi:hypothetical protein